MCNVKENYLVGSVESMVVWFYRRFYRSIVLKRLEKCCGY